MVVMDRQDYISKSNNLAQPAYRPIPKDPTNKIKAKLITILRKVEKETGLDDNTYKCTHPMECNVLKFYWIPKIHKPDSPLRPIVSRRGLVTLEWLRYLPKYLNHWLVDPNTTSIALRILLNWLTR